MREFQIYFDNKINPVVNLLIPVAILLSFSLIGLFGLILELRLTIGAENLLSPTAFYLVDAGILPLISIIGMFFSIVLFIVWLLLILKNRGQYLFSLNRAIFIVICVWIMGTLYIPFLLYLLYKPIL